MKKSEVVALTNEQLFAHLVDLGETYVREVNWGRTNNVTNGTVMDTKFTIEELAKRFNVDADKMIDLLDMRRIFELKGLVKS